jgi:hypothetical protein
MYIVPIETDAKQVTVNIKPNHGAVNRKRFLRFLLGCISRDRFPAVERMIIQEITGRGE